MYLSRSIPTTYGQWFVLLILLNLSTGYSAVVAYSSSSYHEDLKRESKRGRGDGGRGQRGRNAWARGIGYIVPRKIDVQMRHHVITSTTRECYLRGYTAHGDNLCFLVMPMHFHCLRYDPLSKRSVKKEKNETQTRKEEIEREKVYAFSYRFVGRLVDAGNIASTSTMKHCRPVYFVQ